MIDRPSPHRIFNTLKPQEPLELPPEIALQRVIDERAAALFVGVSQPTLERMRKLGTAPRHVVLSTRRLGYRVSDLLAWLDAQAA